MKKRVVILANDTTYTYNLRGAILEELVHQNYEVYVVSQVLEFKEELKKMGCYVINIDINRHGINPISDFKLLKKYRKILKEIKPSVVLSYNIKPNVYGGMICRKLKIKFFPNITGIGGSLYHTGFMRKIAITLNRIGLKDANTVFFQNQENWDFFKSHKILSNKTKICLLPGSGVDLKRNPVLKYPEDDNIRFLFIARIMKDKGIDIYLEIAKAMKEKYPNTEFHICGYCEEEKYRTMLQLYQQQGLIIYHGEQKNLLSFFEVADCIVLPSFHEGMANVLLEAASLGRMIICSDCSGCKEIVDNGKTGYAVSTGDTSKFIEMSEKVIGMSKSERKEMGLNGRRKIEKEFDRKLVVNSYLKAIDDALTL